MNELHITASKNLYFLYNTINNVGSDYFNRLEDIGYYQLNVIRFSRPLNSTVLFKSSEAITFNLIKRESPELLL
jgi:hypothetical protein